MITKDSPERQWMLDPKKLEGKSKEEILQELAKLSGQFKLLMENLDKLPPPVSLSAVELDVAKYKGQIEILEWLKENLPLVDDEQGIDNKLAEVKRQLEAVEKVTCI